ncbi:MAG TPA: MmgE/PrpD family protein [Hyphomicrobiaceae bacterium]|nr:MmgE/PrpD family protein [Hyphomicrobiaceae bacterium]
MSSDKDSAISKHTLALSEYIAGAVDRELPEEVAAKTRLHILDTLAAVLSGSQLKAGRLAAPYVAAIGGVAEATVIGTRHMVPAANAALANGMSGHADETDDSHLGGRFHPGCAIVPAALAVAERHNASGRDFLRAVALGYDVGARLNMSLGYSRPDTTEHSTHSLGALFGSAAAAAAILKLDPVRVRYVLSYAAQQASGVPFWQRDQHHVEKAFDFGGMGARNGVSAALMVAAGFPAVDDPFSGKHNLYNAFAEKPDPARLTDGLGKRYEIMAAAIKKWCVGSPIQSVLDATMALIEGHRISAADVAKVAITMPDDRMHIVDGRDMPDVCVQHLVALALLDGTVGFEAAHDYVRMRDPAVLALRRTIELIPSPELTAAVPARQAIVEIETRDGRWLRHHAKAVRGTPENPMTEAEVEAKALDLIRPIIGPERGRSLVSAAGRIAELATVRELSPLLQA